MIGTIFVGVGGVVAGMMVSDIRSAIRRYRRDAAYEKSLAPRPVPSYRTRYYPSYDLPYATKLNAQNTKEDEE